MQNLKANIQTPGQNPKTVLKDSPLPYPSGSPLGNITSYSANSENIGVLKTLGKRDLTPEELKKIKYEYRKANKHRKSKIGKYVPRVSWCGTRTIKKDVKWVEAVQGEKGGIYYNGMQRCGLIWFCPDCLFKIMKARSEALYKQLMRYKADGKTVLFVTFTLQHHKGEKLEALHEILRQAFNFANSHATWKKAKKRVSVEFLWALEVLYGVNGWHPHRHSAFVGDAGIIEAIKIFDALFKKKLNELGKVTNEHTVVIERWNGKLDEMKDYMFKGMLEQELTSGGLKKSGKGKTFFELVDEKNQTAILEFVDVMKGKRQYHHSKGFFADVIVKSDTEILKDDKVTETLFRIPVEIYSDINTKGIALHLLNEFEYGGKDRAIKLLELYDCDISFFNDV